MFRPVVSLLKYRNEREYDFVKNKEELIMNEVAWWAFVGGITDNTTS